MTTFSSRLTRAMFCVLAFGVIPACGPNNGPSTPPPHFLGLQSATATGTPHQVVLTWNAATDYSGTGIIYNVFWVVGAQPAQSGQETLQFSTPNPTGVTINLPAADPYLIYVQAQDGTGQSDGNTIEFPVTVP